MSGVADICDLPGVEDIEDIIGADDVTPRDRYQNKPVPVPKVRKTKKTKSPVSDLMKYKETGLIMFSRPAAATTRRPQLRTVTS